MKEETCKFCFLVKSVHCYFRDCFESLVSATFLTFSCHVFYRAEAIKRAQSVHFTEEVVTFEAKSSTCFCKSYNCVLDI